MKRQMVTIGLSMLVGVLVSFLLLFLGISGIEAAWSLQMLGMWIGAALGFSVHGPLYLVGALINAALYGVFCWLAFWAMKLALPKRRSSE